MYQNWFYVGTLIVAASIVWLVAEYIGNRQAKKSGIQKTSLPVRAAFVAILIATGGATYCYLNIYQDYGLSSRAELPAAIKAIADAKAAKIAADAKAKRDAEEKEAAERARLLAEADRQQKLAEAQKEAEDKRCSMGTVFSANYRYELRKEPRDDAEKFLNATATEVLKRPQYQNIDASTMVRVVGCSGDWREVKITEPSWLTDNMGWVPASILRSVENSSDGKRVFTEADFYWESDTGPYKTQLVAAVNKIVRETPGCDKIDTASLALSPTHGSPGDPVFFVTCNPEGPAANNVWFRPTDR
ncbi:MULTISPECIES: hypothetical protein [unclassified Rhizobium]|uniref:hypothetical protein n=1 Tax=unclassified Rhizobium TaxID=2613769 RepID=UPI0007E93DF7|nr:MULTISPECIES: hypothetical protein [unclassified Rhizobium]ANK91530.1 hypothetical protein AMK01_CH02071 [Rhizobium sp. N6212]ANK97563.1 hypothetical protein AMK00_CH02073 [Rhizobium sp. N621]